MELSSDYVAGLGNHGGDKVDLKEKNISSLKLLFSNLKSNEVFPSKKIINCEKEDAIKEAFKSLVDNKVLSLPVYNKKAKTHESFVDVVDFVEYIYQYFADACADTSNTEIDAFFSAKDSFSDSRVKAISNLSGKNQYSPVESDAPIRRILDVACKGIHRLPIVDDDGSFHTIISQSDLVKFIHAHSELYGELGAVSVGESKVGSWGEVYSIGTDEAAIDAFKLINEKGVLGVGVVDKDGVLVDNISASDLKTIGADGSNLSMLFQPIGEFLKDKREDAKVRSLLSVKASHSFEHVVGLVVSARAHRVFVVDEQGRPEAVISLVDILTHIKIAVDK